MSAAGALLGHGLARDSNRDPFLPSNIDVATGPLTVTPSIAFDAVTAAMQAFADSPEQRGCQVQSRGGERDRHGGVDVRTGQVAGRVSIPMRTSSR